MTNASMKRLLMLLVILSALAFVAAQVRHPTIPLLDSFFFFIIE